MSCETLKHLPHLSRPGDYFVSLDLADGYYTLGIREHDRDFFTVNYRGELWRLACLPMGWSGSAWLRDTSPQINEPDQPSNRACAGVGDKNAIV